MRDAADRRAEAAERLAADDLEGALAVLDERSEDPEECRLLARMYRALDRPRRAEAFLERAIDIAPLDPTALEELATVRIERGRHFEALDPLARLLRIAPARRTARVLIARAERALGRPGRAVEILDRAVTLDPYDRDAHEEWARLLEDAGEWREAEERWTIVADLAPEAETTPREALERVRARIGAGSPADEGDTA